MSARRSRRGRAATAPIEIPIHAGVAMDMKERCVRANGPGESGWLPPVAMGLRGGRVVALAVAPQVDNRLGLRAAHLLRRAGFATDRIAVAFDVFYSLRKRGDPEPRPGEYQERAKAGATFADDGIGSQVIVLDAGGDGRVGIVGLPYQATGNTVAWLDPGVMLRRRGEAECGGWVADALRSIMAEAPLLDRPEVLAEFRELGLDEASLDRAPRVACRRLLESEGFIVIDYDE